MTGARPRVRLRPGKPVQPLRHGAPWAFADTLVMDRRTKAIPPGSLVILESAEREPLGLAAFNPTSRIAARILSADLDEVVDQAWFEAGLARALALRDRLYPAPFYRLVHAEADGFPGVVIDRFGDAAVIQPNAAWAEVRLEPLAAALRAVTGVETLVKNAGGRARSLEGLDDRSAVLTGALDGPVDVPMNGAIYRADLAGGQKTGLYFDQRENHAFAARLAAGARVLDVFSHVGGFALAALAGGAASALSVDSSAAALTLAEEGAARIGLGERFQTRRGDAFEAMEALGADGATFDLVISDPPAFAPAKPALDAGLRAYERAARLAARLVAPGGILVLCSCSHAADLARFRTASLKGVGRAGRRGQILAVQGAGPDHPVHPYLAESAYLKALFLRLD